MANKQLNLGTSSSKIDVNVSGSLNIEGAEIFSTVDTKISTAIANKADKATLTAHTGNTDNPHSVTKDQIGLGNVEDKSSATIRGELTKENVTNALGYTPPEQDTTYGVATSSTLGLVKSGGDITISTTAGTMSVKDNSHKHTIGNITNLETTLEGKANIADIPTDYVPNTRTINNHSLLGNITLTATDVGAIPTGTKFSYKDDLIDQPSIPSIEGLATIDYVNQELGKKVNTSAIGTAAAKDINDFAPADTLDQAKDYTDEAIEDIPTTYETKADANEKKTALEAKIESDIQTAVQGLASSASVTAAIAAHNQNDSGAHSDIRGSIQALDTKLTNFLTLDSNDDTVNTLSELISAIQTGDNAVQETLNTAINEKASTKSVSDLSTTVSTHTGDTKVHVTDADRLQWNAAEPNQNAFSSIAGISATTSTDSITFTGTNISIKASTAASKDIAFSVPNGTTATKGVVKLVNSTTSASTTTAATPNSVKQAYAAATAAQNTASSKIGSITVSAGTADGSIKYQTDKMDSAVTVAIPGLKSAAYQNTDYFATFDHDHDTEYLSTGTFYAGSTSIGGAATSALYADEANVANKLATTSAVGSTSQPVYFTANGVPSAIAYTIKSNVPKDAVFTDTIGKNFISSASTGVSNKASTSGTVYLNHVAGGAAVSSNAITGAGSVSVTSDNSGKIIITGTDTDTKNTAGATTSEKKLYLVGSAATASSSSAVTYIGSTAIGSAPYMQKGQLTAPNGFSGDLAGLASSATYAVNAKSATSANSASTATIAKATTGTLTVTVNNTNTEFDGSADKNITIPTATKDVAGLTIVYPAANCTSYTSDSGTCTPAAVKKATGLFSVPRVGSTDDAIARFNGSDGDIQNSNILIQNVTNTKDSSHSGQIIVIPGENGNKMVYGYCTDQTDGTSFIGGMFPSSATAYPYAEGLAIGGSTKNLLWKGAKVATVNDIPGAATTTTAGLMSAADKVKLNGIATGANKYTHPTYAASTGVPTANATLTHGGTFAVSQPIVNSEGHVIALNGRTYTMPSETALSKGNPINGTETLTHGGTFNAISGFSVDDHTITPTITTFTLPSDNDTKNTAGATTSSSKLYLIGAASTGANPKTYAHTSVHMTNGTLAASTFSGYLNGTAAKASSATKATSATTATNAGTATYATSAGSATNADTATYATNSGTATYAKSAATATRLKTSRTVRTNLGSTATASFNGTANITPGVTGTLPIGNGGTGGADADTALTNLGATYTINAIADLTAAFTAMPLYSTRNVWILGTVFKTLTNSLDAGNQAHGYMTKLTDSILELRVGGGGYKWTIRVDSTGATTSCYDIPDDLQTTALRDQATVSNARARNITCTISDITAGSSSLVSGRICFVYS